jgi:hypothetical protein
VEKDTKTVKLTRVQLKLGNSKMSKDDVQKIKDDMFSRGKTIVEELRSNNYLIASYCNILLTTRFCSDCDEGFTDSRDGTGIDGEYQSFATSTFPLHD